MKKSIQTRQKILSVALKLFRMKGYEETTMRDIAKEVGLSPGAAYYYFDSKDELVLAFYRQLADEAEREQENLLESGDDFRSCFEKIIRFKLRQIAPYRSLVSVLIRQAAVVDSKLSPFSQETAEIRESAIGLISKAIKVSKFKTAKRLQDELPRLLWLYQMGIIFFWANDRSQNQEATERVIEQSLGMILLLLKSTRIPLMGPVVNKLLEVASITRTAFGAPA